MLAAVLEQEQHSLAENLRLEQEQVGGPPRRPLAVEQGQDSRDSLAHRASPTPPDLWA